MFFETQSPQILPNFKLATVPIEKSLWPPSKMTLFLYIQITLVSASHISLHIRLICGLNPVRYKLRNWPAILLPVTKNNAVHLSHLTHSLCATSPDNIICWIDFASLLHKGHRLYGSLNPLFSRLILDGNLSIKTLKPNTLVQ